jgi:hypothetical protein
MDSLQFLIILCYRNYEYLFHGYYQNLLVAGIFYRFTIGSYSEAGISKNYIAKKLSFT